jgi:hypothetical protein
MSDMLTRWLDGNLRRPNVEGQADRSQGGETTGNPLLQDSNSEHAQTGASQEASTEEGSENTKENKTQKSKLDKCNSPHNCQNL